MKMINTGEIFEVAGEFYVIIIRPDDTLDLMEITHA
jgi:hypothetical protein